MSGQGHPFDSILDSKNDGSPDAASHRLPARRAPGSRSRTLLHGKGAIGETATIRLRIAEFALVLPK
jgi:hypothetical protein